MLTGDLAQMGLGIAQGQNDAQREQGHRCLPEEGLAKGAASPPKDAGHIPGNSPPFCTERKKFLSAARSDSRRRKKVDLKSKLQIRTKGLYRLPPLLRRKSIRIESQLIFWETNVK